MQSHIQMPMYKHAYIFTYIHIHKCTHFRVPTQHRYRTTIFGQKYAFTVIFYSLPGKRIKEEANDKNGDHFWAAAPVGDEVL